MEITMHKVLFLSILSLSILSSSLCASDKDESLVSSIMQSQFPFSSLNSVERQQKMSDVIVQNYLEDALSSGSYVEYKNTVFAVVAGSMLHNEKQEMLNKRANISFFGAVPFMFSSNTRKVGIGMMIGAGALKIDAARRLPNIDTDYVVARFNMIESQISEPQQEWQLPDSSQNLNDIL